MRETFAVDALNIAPGARRYPPIVWLLLCVSVGLCAAAANSLYQGMQQLHVTRAALDEQVAKQEQVKKAQRRRAQERESSQSRDRGQELQRIKDLTGLSWGGLFDSLELAAKATRGGASVVSMTTEGVDTTSARVNLTAVAASPHVMLFYIDELKKNKHIVQVELTNQQPEESLSPSAVRFQLVATWNPAATDAQILDLPKAIPIAPVKGRH